MATIGRLATTESLTKVHARRVVTTMVVGAAVNNSDERGFSATRAWHGRRWTRHDDYGIQRRCSGHGEALQAQTHDAGRRKERRLAMWP